MHADHRNDCRVAILDDYQRVAVDSAEWASLGSDVAVQAFSDHLTDRDELVERLAGFAVVVAMRERTPFPRDLLTRLPDLRLLVTTGMKNASMDVPAAAELGITVCGTPLAGSSTVELTWALIMAVTRDPARTAGPGPAGGSSICRSISRDPPSVCWGWAGSDGGSARSRAPSG